MNVSAKRVMNGTFSEVWVDGILVAGLSAFQAKVSKQKSDINMCGAMFVDSKTTNAKGTGSIEFHKIFTMYSTDAEKLKNGVDDRHTIIGKLADPDAYGTERIAFYNCSYDEHTLFDAAAGQPGKGTMPFTFTDFDYLDKVER